MDESLGFHIVAAHGYTETIVGGATLLEIAVSDNGHIGVLGDDATCVLGFDRTDMVTIFNINCGNYKKRDFQYIEIDIFEDDLVELVYCVNGGYEYDTGAYWGGEEYVEELMGMINTPSNIDLNYSLDHEDLSGAITIKYKE